MYSVTKRIEFCYGHRLLEYDGVCKHPHGHNAVAEIEVRTASLDARDMVCDFSDIKQMVKGSGSTVRFDHRMILRRDDPLLEPLRALGEPVCGESDRLRWAGRCSSRPAARPATSPALIFEKTESFGFPVVRVTVWETPASFATYVGESAPSASSKPSPADVG